MACYFLRCLSVGPSFSLGLRGLKSCAADEYMPRSVIFWLSSPLYSETLSHSFDVATLIVSLAIHSVNDSYDTDHALIILIAM